MTEGTARQVAGRYTLVREVGRGGMGAVWLAYDEVLRRSVALKQLAMANADDQDLRVEREARVSAMVNHPNIVTVFDLAHDGADSWLVMEYVDPLTLAAQVRDHGPLTPDEAAPLLAQAAAALATAHGAGIVHRDVKPGNMLVDSAGLLKLGDFGIARSGADASLTRTGLVTGSPGYLAPEVAAGGTATAASDIWSLGASIFHALTGRPPYDTSENLMGALYRLVNEEPPRTDKAGWLDPVLRATMERDPERRWTADQVHAFLSRTGSPTPVARRARPAAVAAPTRVVVPPEPQATQRFAPPARHRGRKLGLVAAALVVIAALSVGGWLIGRDRPTDNGGNPPSGDPTTGSTEEVAVPTEDGMISFVGEYLAVAPTNPELGYQMLTPEFQKTSGFLNGYRSWWDRVESATINEIDADPTTLSVRYNVHYVMKNGPERDEAITLRLAFDDGTYLVAGE